MIPLFRAKRKYNGQWVEGCLIYNLDPHQEKSIIADAYIREPLRNLGNTYEVDPLTIGMYVGEKDERGKKVFTGDIVQYDTDYGAVQAEVIFETSAGEGLGISGFRYAPYSTGGDHDSDEPIPHVVVYNIHDGTNEREWHGKTHPFGIQDEYS